MTTINHSPLSMPRANCHGIVPPRATRLCRTSLVFCLGDVREHACIGWMRGGKSHDVVWGCYYTVLAHNVSLSTGVMPSESLPLAMSPSRVLFLSSRPLKDLIPLHSSLIGCLLSWST
jgi:hypothetical protein